MSIQQQSQKKWINFFELWKRTLQNITFNHLVEEAVSAGLIWRRVDGLIGVENRTGAPAT